MFNAIVLTQEGKATRAQLRPVDEAELPEGDVDVRVASLGQITNALFEVGGQYRRSM